MTAKKNAKVGEKAIKPVSKKSVKAPKVAVKTTPEVKAPEAVVLEAFEETLK